MAEVGRTRKRAAKHKLDGFSDTARLLMMMKLQKYWAQCRFLRLRRELRNLVTKPVSSTYIFLLCPPYCGSTLLHQILCTSPAVSPCNIHGTGEGFGLPEIQSLVDFSTTWTTREPFPWAKIKPIWQRYWDHSKPLLLEKSPQGLIQAPEIEKHFTPVQFIAMVRNPYVHCEALMRRNGMSGQEAARRALHCLQLQQRNIAELGSVSVISYEQLTDRPLEVAAQLIGFIPALGTLDVRKRFKSHYHDRGPGHKIKNRNIGKIEAIRPEARKEIYRELAPHGDLLRSFGYQLKS